MAGRRNLVSLLPGACQLVRPTVVGALPGSETRLVSSLFARSYERPKKDLVADPERDPCIDQAGNSQPIGTVFSSKAASDAGSDAMI